MLSHMMNQVDIRLHILWWQLQYIRSASAHSLVAVVSKASVSTALLN